MKIRYLCDHCNGSFLESELDILLEHELECHKNPKNRTCDTCKHSEMLFINGRDFCVLESDFNSMYNHTYVMHCNKWETDDNQILRKIKLEQINEQTK